MDEVLLVLISLKLELSEFLPKCIKKVNRLYGTALLFLNYYNNVGSVVEWLKHQARNQHGLGSKLTHAILLCLWERHFTAPSPA